MNTRNGGTRSDERHAPIIRPGTGRGLPRAPRCGTPRDAGVRQLRPAMIVPNRALPHANRRVLEIAMDDLTDMTDEEVFTVRRP